MGRWPAGLPGALVGVGVGGSLRGTISLSAFDLGQGLPASKWSQLLLQAEASGQKGLREEIWRVEECGGERIQEPVGTWSG